MSEIIDLEIFHTNDIYIYIGIYVMLYTAVTNFSLLLTWLNAPTYSDLCGNQNNHHTYCGGYEFTELQLHPQYDSKMFYLHNNLTALHLTSDVKFKSKILLSINENPKGRENGYWDCRFVLHILQ